MCQPWVKTCTFRLFDTRRNSLCAKFRFVVKALWQKQMNDDDTVFTTEPTSIFGSCLIGGLRWTLSLNESFKSWSWQRKV